MSDDIDPELQELAERMIQDEIANNPPIIDIRRREPRPDFLGPILDEVPWERLPAYGPGNPPPESEALAEQLDLDLLLWGNAYLVDGKRVDPTTVMVRRRTPQGEAEQVHPPIHSQEEFLTALDILLDHTLHADECYTDPNDTVCVCVIGKVRAALPPCGAVRVTPGNAHLWHCVRNAHPASPDRHVWG